MEKIIQYAKENYVPIIRNESLKILIDCIKQHNAQKVLEIGTAIGYSGINILNNTNAHLTTVELDKTRYEVAKTNFERFGLCDRVNAHNIDALTLLKNLVEKGEKYDFVFLDGPKGQYIKYLPYLEKLLTDGGVIFADNVLFKGMVNSNEYPPHKYRTIVVNLRKYLQAVNNPPFKTQLIQLEDGIAITQKEEK